jgi:hypothetical protein
MAANPAGPGSSGEREDEGAPRERYGPLALERLRKQDGRQLLLFSHARGEQQDGRADGQAQAEGG